MASIKLKFRPSTADDKEGALYYQIIHERTVRRVATNYHIYKEEWNEETGCIILPNENAQRHGLLRSIQNDVKWALLRFDCIMHRYGSSKVNIDNIVSDFQGFTSDGKGVFSYIFGQIERLANIGRLRSSEAMRSSLKSFMRFRGGLDLTFSRIDSNLMEQYEAYLKHRGVTRNTSSFYMRNLRSAYNNAVREGVASNQSPFDRVYTGVDKTSKRAISINELRKIKKIDVSSSPSLNFAKDILLFSFYTRGMSFVDMANLKKKDVVDGYITYSRKKTGQRLSVEVEPELKVILNKYKSTTQYLLPIITKEDGTERTQYRNQLVRINRNLRKLGKMAGLSIPLTTYVARHAWASIARTKGIALPVISQALGHDNEITTQIYLDSIRANEVDKANRTILDEL